MKVDKISELTTSRLSIYLRCLQELAAEGVKSASSDVLAKRFHLNSAQIRKDLAYFGEFGVRGVGYHIEMLRDHLIGILGLNKQHCVGIFGAGRLGTALADYYGFSQTNFTVAALFDDDSAKIGKKIGEVEVFGTKNFAEIAEKYKIELAVIAVPAEYAQNILEIVTKAGIKAVMNFAPTPLRVADGVKLKNVDLTITLEGLSYFLAQPAANGNNVKQSAASRRK